MPVSMNLMGMQAESMLVAAMNKGKNFDRAATAFFKTANEAGLESNALVALNSKVRDLTGTKNVVKRAFRTEKIVSTFVNAMENSAKKGTELRKQYDLFFKSLKKNYPNTFDVRLALARNGAVRADCVHKSTFAEKFVAGIKNLVREDLL